MQPGRWPYWPVKSHQHAVITNAATTFAICYVSGTVVAGIHWSALSSSYVLAANDQEAAVMVRHLGVQAPTAAQVYRREVLPRLSSLPQMVRDPAMLLMLRHLSDLQQQDRSFTQLLSGTAFLPSGNGELHVPSDLYDPRIPELVALLDPEACFPAPAFCGDVSDAMQDGEQQQQRDGGSSNSSFSSLVVLQQLGLRCTAQLDTLVLAARFVQKVAADGDEDMAVARGKVGAALSMIQRRLLETPGPDVFVFGGDQVFSRV